jgi:hypothetical protein
MIKEKYIEKLTELYGCNSFDFDNIFYTNDREPTTITCLVHSHTFTKVGRTIIRTRGCKYCIKNKLIQTNKISKLIQFKEKLISRWPSLSIPSESLFINSETKLIINCSVHGRLSNTPKSFLKYGCLACKKENNVKSLDKTSQMILKLEGLYPDKYDYSVFNYTSSSSKVDIICKTHGHFSKVVSTLLRGIGCNKCSQEKRSLKITTESFIKKIEAKYPCKFTFDKTVYTGSINPATITCVVHGDITKTAFSFYRLGCNRCQLDDKYFQTSLFLDKFEKVHDKSKYDLTNLVYKGSHSLVTLSCNKHGEFTKPAYRVLQSINPCPKCSFSVSKPELELASYITTLDSKTLIIPSYRPSWLLGKELDLYLPSLNLAIEYNGSIFHHSSYGVSSFLDSTLKDKTYHFEKWKVCKDNGVILISIYDFYWLDKNKQNVYKQHIKLLLNVENNTPVHLSDCTLLVDNLTFSELSKFHEENNTKLFVSLCDSTRSYQFYKDSQLVCSVFKVNKYHVFSYSVLLSVSDLVQTCAQLGITDLIVNLDLQSHFVTESSMYLFPSFMSVTKTSQIEKDGCLRVYGNGYARIL